MATNRYLFSSLYTRTEIENQIALASNGVTYTYKDFRCAVELCATDLMKRGVNKDSRVAISSYDEIKTLVVLCAVMRLGAVAVMINNNVNAKFLTPLFKFSDVNFIAYGINKDTMEVPDSWETFAADLGLEGRTYNFCRIDYKERIERNEMPDILPDEDQNEKRPAVLMYTTGTTSQPKAVVHSQESFMVAAASYRARFCPYAGESVAVALPLYHCFGLTASLATLMHGLYCCFPRALKLPMIIDLIRTYKPSIMVSVGAIYLGLLQSEDFKEYAYPYLKTCIVGGAFTAPEHIVTFEKLYPNMKFVIGYGMTETAACITLTEPSAQLDKRSQTVGKVLDSVDLRICKDGQMVQEAGTNGEVCVRGRNLMLGYYKVDASHNSVDREGWLHTGDLGYLDDEGYLHLTGRIKDLIIKNGENVSPDEIYRALLKNSDIKTAHVLGIPDESGNESICACVVMKKNRGFNEDDIKKQLKDYLNSFKIPDYFMEYKELPLTGIGKVDKSSIIKQFNNRRSGNN